jgi:exodeoxyribonuclease V gamma subunit
VHVHRSNRTERLVDALAEIVREPSGDAFARECIAVQGRGMERWLAMELAKRLGVWANPDFPFPRRLIERILGAVPGAARGDGSAFEPERMLWSIRALLPDLAERPELAPIATYLAGDDRGVRALQLAERIADTFDHYVVHRPDLVTGWERGRGDPRDWQPLLWRALAERLGSHHVAARAGAFLAAAAAGRIDMAALPKRISLFGISTLPPLYVEILDALSRHLEVHLFLLSPSREYWAQIRSQRQIRREVLRAGGDPEAAEQSLHLEVGHPLLASLGRVGREFQSVLEATNYREDGGDLYEDPGFATALATLQSDILALRHRGGPDGPPRLPLGRDDTSIRIHSCHGPMREVEVLHDQLLALFDEIPDLEPHEVVVMTPDIDAYAPAIEAVFGSASSPIPYRVSDRGPRTGAEVVDAFDRVLDLLAGRMKAPDVVDLLGIGAVRNRFGIAPGDLDLLREWIREAGIRWGVDADHRAATGLPALDQNTWRFGLDRLLLGYALDDATNLFGGALPCLTVEGTTARLLGALVELLEVLFEWRKRLAEPRTPVEWGHELAELLAATIADDPATADQVQGLAAALDDVAERAATAGFDAPIALDAFRIQLDGELRRRATTHGFLSRGVCFCELVPMRTIPFRVVCLVGMSDGVFPRTERPLGFDLMARHSRPGDRSAREDDRYLFLEALMAARERLIVTYVGQGIRDNDVRPPSVVVSELLDALDETFCTDGEAGVKQFVEVVHPLQAFSPRYVGAEPESGLFSFRVAERRAAEALLADPSPPAPFVAAPLPSVPSQEIPLDDLVEFFRRPARWFARRQLDLPPQREIPRLESREPIDPDALERWSIGNRIVESRLRGAAIEIEGEIAHLRAAGSLPPGALGDLSFRRIRPEVDATCAAAERYRRAAAVDAIALDRVVRGARVVGRIENLRTSGLVHVHFSRVGSRQDIPWWVRHVFLCLLSPAGIAPVTIVVGRAAKVGDPTAVRFGPLADAEAIAGDLVDLYRAGQREPLPLFPDTSREFAEEYRKSKNESDALAAAAQLEERRTGHEARIRDADVELLFRGRDRLAPSAGAGRPGFAEVALRFFLPLLEHTEEA